MRKRKFAGGMVALCLALSVAGCGKSSEEKQAANYYQKELGFDKDEAEELAHEIYGKDKDEEKPSATEAPEETVVEPLPEIVNSEWWERKVQILDMVFTNDWTMTEEDIRKIVEGSAYDVEIVEDFDENGEIHIKDLKLNGEQIAVRVPVFETTFAPEDYAYRKAEPFGWFNDELYYHIPIESLSSYSKACWYDKQSIESADLDFKTRNDVLTYLSENGFVEVEEEQACYSRVDYNQWVLHITMIPLDEVDVEYIDTPHYYCKGMQSIKFYRMHKLDETDKQIEMGIHKYSEASLYLFTEDTITFNTDGTIDRWSSEKPREVTIAREEKEY